MVARLAFSWIGSKACVARSARGENIADEASLKLIAEAEADPAAMPLFAPLLMELPTAATTLVAGGAPKRC